MKKTIFTTAFIILSQILLAQETVKIKTTSPSPAASFEQEIGSTIINVNYSRPLARDRKIFGELVPFDKMWRTGASDNTTFTTNEDIFIAGNNLPAGKYSLFTIPSQNEWTIILNTDSSMHGDSGYDQNKDALRFKIQAEKSNSYYETFTIEINDINSKGEGYLKLIWENTMVRIPIKSKADENLMALIKKNLIDNKSKDAEVLYQAAHYYSSTKRDYPQAIAWLEEAERIDPKNFYSPFLRQKLLAAEKDYASAIKAAERAISIADPKKMAGNIKTLQKNISDYQMLVNSSTKK